MDQRVVEKIQKLLARGDESRNDNAHEREIAMRQAHALLAKHGLALQDVTDAAEVKEHLGRLGRQEVGIKTRYVWESGVWNEIARLNGCKIVRASGSKKVWVIGRELRGEVVKSMSRYCVDSILSEARKRGHSVVSFGVGAWRGLDEQVSDILESMERGRLGDEQVSTGTALVLVNQHKTALVEAQTAIKEFFGRTTKGSYSYGGSGTGYGEGKAYGRKISLNNQISGTGSAKRIATCGG